MQAIGGKREGSLRESSKICSIGAWHHPSSDSYRCGVIVAVGERREGNVRVNVDTAACIGAGQCALVAPDVFDQDDDGIVMLLNAAPSEPEHAATRRAAALCPARVIVVDESE